MIVTLTGSPRLGRTKLARNLLRTMPNAQILRNTTILGTRAPHKSDLPKEYEYIAQNAFNRAIQLDSFAWCTKMHGSQFGTRKKYVDESLDKRDIYITILDIPSLKELYIYARKQGKEDHVRSLYLDIHDYNKLRKCLRESGVGPEKIEYYIEECKSWHKEMLSVDFVFMSIDVSGSEKETLASAREALNI